MNMRIVMAGALTLGAAITVIVPAHGQDVLIRGAQVHTAGDAGTLEDSDVRVRGGRIVAVGKGLPVEVGVEVVEAAGRPLTPGLFAGISNIGLSEVMDDDIQFKLNLAAPAYDQRWRPEFDVGLAFNPRSVVVPVTRTEGITWTVLAPVAEDSILAGQGMAVTLDGRYDAELPGSRSLFVDWTGPSAKNGGTRAGLFMLFEQALRETRLSGPMGHGMLLQPAGREALKSYLGDRRVVFGVGRAVDIVRLLELARRHDIRPIIGGGTEAWMVADQLARADVPVILHPHSNLPFGFSQGTLDNARILHEAGVRIVFTSGHLHNARTIRQVAGNAVAQGVPWEVALQAVTSTAADVFGLGDTHGQIAVGRQADLVLWDGDPLELTTQAQHVWIAGRTVEMRSRQTKLRDRYLQRLRMNRLLTGVEP
ncbi:amidohydrolase family protein [Luteimonas sp. TWI662]|uniref:amidohydrolase family protein n=1 Tax=Luteimonas sp. TWI662 TaxID=3136789 RepID=UPI00320B5980